MEKLKEELERKASASEELQAEVEYLRASINENDLKISGINDMNEALTEENERVWELNQSLKT
jgi:prefoldin subunit 5